MQLSVFTAMVAPNSIRQRCLLEVLQQFATVDSCTVFLWHDIITMSYAMYMQHMNRIALMYRILTTPPWNGLCLFHDEHRISCEPNMFVLEFKYLVLVYNFP